MMLQLLYVASTVLMSTSIQDNTLPVDMIARTARSYLGEQYVWGDTGEHGYDCSSFVQTVFAQSGYMLPRTSREQVLVGEPLGLDEVQPGDLLFFTSAPGSSRITHVGIALPQHRMIHASKGHQRVVISKWDTSYFRNRWFAARRIH